MILNSFSIEYNNFSPVFDNNTPRSLRLKYTRRTRRAIDGRVVLDVNATDADPPNEPASRISYSLLRAPFPQPLNVGDCTTIMCIDNDSGVVTVNSDLETLAGNFSDCILTVKAEDNAGIRRSTTATITIVLIPVPIINSEERIQIEENLALGSVIANSSCSEVGPSSGPLHGSLQGIFSRYFEFKVERSTLSIARTFDFETLPNRSSPFFEITILCQNKHGLSDTQNITIEILNLDDNHFLFQTDTYFNSIPEDFTVGHSLLTVTAYDADFPEGMVEYFFVNGSEYFALNSMTGVVTVIAPLDREYQDLFTLEVMARLQETGQIVTVDMNVFITDINDEVPVFVLQFLVVHNLT